jgi:peptide/nickel transport system substrate-binding protein
MYSAPNLYEAKNFLVASGYNAENPLRFELWYPGDHYGSSTANWMQEIKKELEVTGIIQVDLKSQAAWPDYVSTLNNGKIYQAALYRWSFDYPDPSNYLDPFVFNGGGGSNITLPDGSPTGKPINDKAKELVDLLKQADIEIDQSRRADLYGKAQDLYADLVVTLPLFYKAEHVVYQNYMKGSANFSAVNELNIGPVLQLNYSTLVKTR